MPVGRRDLVLVYLVVTDVEGGEMIVADIRADQREMINAPTAICIEAIEVEIKRRIPGETPADCRSSPSEQK